MWSAEWSIVQSTVHGEQFTTRVRGHLWVDVIESDVWQLDLVIDEVELPSGDVGETSEHTASIRVNLAPGAEIEGLDVDLGGHLGGVLPLVQFVGDLALVQLDAFIDESRSRPGSGGHGRVRATGSGWERAAYERSLYLPNRPVRVVSSTIRRGARQGPLYGLHVREIVADDLGNALTLTVSIVPEVLIPVERSTRDWHSLDARRPFASILTTTRDVERADGLDAHRLLDDLLDVLPSGEVGQASAWIPRYAARLRLSPWLADAVVEQTLAHLGSANDLGLARVVDALIASGTSEAEAALRRLFDAPQWGRAPNALLTMQHLALFEGLSVETLDWAVQQAVSHPDPDRRVIAVAIAASAMWALRATHRHEVHEAASQLLGAVAAIDDTVMRTRWLRVMSNAGEPRFLTLADAALQSEDVELRAAGARLYRRVNTPESWSRLLSAADDPADRVASRALLAIAEHPQFAARRDEAIEHFAGRVGRRPVVDWLIARDRDSPLSGAACGALLEVAGVARVPESQQRPWGALLERCEALVLPPTH